MSSVNYFFATPGVLIVAGQLLRYELQYLEMKSTLSFCGTTAFGLLALTVANAFGATLTASAHCEIESPIQPRLTSDGSLQCSVAGASTGASLMQDFSLTDRLSEVSNPRLQVQMSGSALAYDLYIDYKSPQMRLPGSIATSDFYFSDVLAADGPRRPGYAEVYIVKSESGLDFQDAFMMFDVFINSARLTTIESRTI